MPVDFGRSTHGSYDDINLQTQLKEIKRELKDWEHAFMSREGRKPSKQDISGDKEIAKRYKFYSKLKAEIEKDADAIRYGNAKPGEDEREEIDISYNSIPASQASLPRPPSNPPKRNDVRRSSRSEAKTTEERKFTPNSINDESQMNDAQRSSTSSQDLSKKEDEKPRKGSSTFKANHLLQKEALYASTSRFSEQDISERPISASSMREGNQLPDNFRLRKSTLGISPIPTSNVHKDSKRGSEARCNSPYGQQTSLSPEKFISPSFISKLESDPINQSFSGFSSNDIEDFKRRKSQIESASIRPSTPVDLLPNSMRPTSPTSTSTHLKADTSFVDSYIPAGPISRPTQINVQASSKYFNTINGGSSIETNRPDLRDYAKPYDPNEEEESENDDDVGSSMVTPSHLKSSIAFKEETQTLQKSQDCSHIKDIGEDEVATEDTIQPSLSPVTEVPPLLQTKSFTITNSRNIDLFNTLPKDGVIKCRLYRKASLLEKNFPTFYLHNEADDEILLVAKKRKKLQSVHYVICTDTDSICKESKEYVAKLRANFSRCEFVLSDARDCGTSITLREEALIQYTKTVRPREMRVGIRSPNIDVNTPETPSDISKDFANKNTNKLHFLKNKAPRWNESTQSHCLNFGGRVTMPSIKNFQIISEDDAESIVLQFGRCGTDNFTMDARYPLSIIQAFGVALSTFDAYDNDKLI